MAGLPMGSSIVVAFSSLYSSPHLSTSRRSFSMTRSDFHFKSCAMAARPTLRLVQLFEEEKVAFIKKKEKEIVEKFSRKKAKCHELAQRVKVLKEEFASVEAEVNGIKCEHQQLLAQKATLKGPRGEETPAASPGSDSHLKSHTMATRPALRLVQLFEEEKAAFIKKKEQEIVEKLSRKEAKCLLLALRFQISLEESASLGEELNSFQCECEQLLAQKAILKEETAAFIKKKEKEVVEKAKRFKAIFEEWDKQNGVSKEKTVSLKAELNDILNEFEQLLAEMATLKGPNGEEIAEATIASWELNSLRALRWIADNTTRFLCMIMVVPVLFGLLLKMIFLF